MKSITAPSERIEFTKRLVTTLAGLGLKPSASSLVKIFNARSTNEPITSHGFRKWLRAESMPTQSNICVLAEWRKVMPEWLRYGDQDPNTLENSKVTNVISREIFLIVRDYNMLSDHPKKIFIETLKSLLALQEEEKTAIVT